MGAPWSSGAWGPGPNGPVVNPPLVGYLLPLAYAPDRRDQRVLVSPPKDTGKVG